MNLSDTIPISIFVDTVSLVVVGVGCLVVAVASQMSGSTRGFVVLRDIGLPLGLLGALAGASRLPRAGWAAECAAAAAADQG